MPAKMSQLIKFIAVKQAIRDQRASFNEAIYIFGHLNDPFQLKCEKFFHGYERNYLLIEAMFDWHLALTAGKNIPSSKL